MSQYILGWIIRLCSCIGKGGERFMSQYIHDAVERSMRTELEVGICGYIFPGMPEYEVVSGYIDDIAWKQTELVKRISEIAVTKDKKIDDGTELLKKIIVFDLKELKEKIRRVNLSYGRDIEMDRYNIPDWKHYSFRDV